MGQAAQVLQRLQELETVASKQLDLAMTRWTKVGIASQMLCEAGVRRRGDSSFRRIPQRILSLRWTRTMWWREAGDAMDANMIVEESPIGASESSGRSKDPEFVNWYYEKE